MRGRNAARYIRAIDRMNGISAAADELGISQPALSSYLKKIEEQLGSTVFDRTTTPISLTEVGRAYLEYEAGADLLERNLMNKIADIEGLRLGSLTVGATASLSISLLPSAIARFAAQFPGIEISVIAGTLPDLARKALEGSIDVFIATSLQDNGAFDCVELMQERFFLCVPDTWPVCAELPFADNRGYATIERDDFALLEDCTFVSMQDNQQMGKKLEELFEFYDVKPKQVIRVNQALTSLALTMQGVGVSLVTEGALNCYRSERMPALYLPDAQTCSRTLYLAKPKNRTLSGAVDQFMNIVRNEIG